MLAVITDDFTGASEIAGVAFAKGFSTVIETGDLERPNAEVLVVATNMRSQTPVDAARESSRLTERILAFSPDIIFKKVDSVLRGNIGPELEAQMKSENKLRALLVPANPTLHRTIVDGIYFVGETPFANSDFADNDAPALDSSSVVDILSRRGTTSATCISPADPFNGVGVHVGNTESSDDLAAWAARVDDELVPAGAAEFFAAILDARMPAPRGGLVGYAPGAARALALRMRQPVSVEPRRRPGCGRTGCVCARDARRDLLRCCSRYLCRRSLGRADRQGVRVAATSRDRCAADAGRQQP